MRRWTLVIGLLLALARTLAAGEGEIPAQYEPFEHLIGPWKGTAVPAANRLKGWSESHTWSWKFVKGTPVGITVEFKGNKTIKSGSLNFDAATKKYTLNGVDPNDKPATFQGTLDPTGKFLALDRTDEIEGAKERLTIRLLPENTIRYNVWVDRRESGAPQFKRTIEVGLTKEGEAFAAGGGATDLPKCIITGGAAGMTVVYLGVSYPLCCTGCRDEFNESPEKYVKKAALRAQSAPATKPAAAAKTGKDDGDFDGLVDAPKTKAMPKEKAKAKDSAEGDPSTPKTETDKVGEHEIKALQLMKQAQTLEKTGKVTGAVSYYRRVVKEFPDTPQSKLAAERIKALNP